MIKQFDNFSERSTSVMAHVKYMRKVLNILPYAEWKRTRSAISPALTGAKMKKLVAVINEVVGNLSRRLAVLTQDRGTAEVALKPLFQAYTMDVICNLVFSRKVDSQVKKTLVNFKNLMQQQCSCRLWVTVFVTSEVNVFWECEFRKLALFCANTNE